MRLVKITVTEQFIRQSLHMPDDCTILGVTEQKNHSGYTDVEFTMLIPGEIQESENPDIVKVTPIVTFEAGKYTWDWNLPKNDEKT